MKQQTLPLLELIVALLGAQLSDSFEEWLPNYTILDIQH